MLKRNKMKNARNRCTYATVRSNSYVVTFVLPTNINSTFFNELHIVFVIN